MPAIAATALRTALGFALASATALAIAPPSSAAPLDPLVDCSEPTEDGRLRYYFGYANVNPNQVSVPFGTYNYFAPPSAYRGQPQVFEPGLHREVFALILSPDQTVTWNLDGRTATASEAVPPCDRAVPNWRGPWEAETGYLAQDLVSWEGSTWIAVDASPAVPPALDTGWDLFAAAGQTGEAGPPGPRGPAGPPGPAGPRGDSGVAVGAVERFDRRGIVRVRDARVEASSFVLLQYTTPQRLRKGARRRSLRPTNVVGVRPGGFTATGSPGARFRYVVHSSE